MLLLSVVAPVTDSSVVGSEAYLGVKTKKSFLSFIFNDALTFISKFSSKI